MSNSSSAGRATRLGLAVLTLQLSAVAFAQTSVPVFQLERLELDPSAGQSLVSASGRLPPPGTLRASAGLQYENTPLMLMRGTSGLGALVRNRLTLDLA